MSTYNKELNCIYIHVPRTAGTSMEELLGKTGHKDIVYFKRFFNYYTTGNIFDDAFKFGFVRNPWDKFVASYLQLEGSSKKNIHKYIQEMANCEHHYENESIPEILMRPQWMFLYRLDETLLVDFVGRFESLKDDWEHICNTLNIKHKLPHLNKSRHEPWQNYYTTHTKQIIYELYKKDFEMFYPMLK